MAPTKKITCGLNFNTYNNVVKDLNTLLKTTTKLYCNIEKAKRKKYWIGIRTPEVKKCFSSGMLLLAEKLGLLKLLNRYLLQHNAN